MAKSLDLDSLKPYLLPAPALLLSAEFLIGGYPRVFGLPFRSLHSRIYIKSLKTAPTLYPLVPFRNVRAHMIYVGAWMMGTGALLAWPRTRGHLGTLGLVYFWTGAGVWSQRKVGMPFWLPVLNALAGTVIYFIERGW